ncbi:MAG: hypothetical protein AB1598_12230 [Thermodesulfobacteriota bacterium]
MTGPKINYIAKVGENKGWRLLGDEPQMQWKALERYIAENWGKDKAGMKAILGCLVKLDACLMQISRIREFYDKFIQSASDNATKNKGKEFLFVLNGQEAIADFESLLLHGRAALDRLTWLVSEKYNSKTQSYRSLEKILNNFAHKDQKAKNILEFVNISNSWVLGLLATVGNDESFRDFVAHKIASIEKRVTCFQIHVMTDGKCILLDCVLDRFPVFKSSTEAVKFLSYLVLNSLATIVEQKVYSIDKYDSLWENKAVVFADFVLDEPENSPLGKNHLRVVSDMNPDNFVLRTRNVRPDIFNHSIKLL